MACERWWWFAEHEHARRARAARRARRVMLAVVLAIAATMHDSAPSQVTSHEEVPEDAFVQATRAAGKSGRRTIPAQPLEGQKTRGCEEEDSETINGGCWVRLERRPPCGARHFEHRGGCYMPVAEDPKTPVAEPPRQAVE